MFERFTEDARKVMALANMEAQRLNQDYIGTEHILLGLVEEGTGAGANVLKSLGVDLGQVQANVLKSFGVNLPKNRVEGEKFVKPGPAPVAPRKLPTTPRAKKVAEYAIDEARQLNQPNIGSEHLLLGLMRAEDGLAAMVLTNLGLKLEDVRLKVTEGSNNV